MTAGSAKMYGQTSDRELKKALIAMSGGVDSSMAAALLCEQGFSCIGCTMKLYENNRHEILNDTARDEAIADILAFIGS